VKPHLGLLPGLSAAGPVGSQANQSSQRHLDHTREHQFYQQRAFQKGSPVASDIYDQALRQWSRLPRVTPSRAGQGTGMTPAGALASVTSLVGTVWTPIGPSPAKDSSKNENNGRTSSIAINPNNPNVIYQGSSGGGVWRTIDGGATWTPLTDQQSSLGTGEPSAIAIDPSNTDTLYVGTSQRFVLNISKGILKSTDGGGSWIVLGSGFPEGNTGNAGFLFNGQNINVILVDPSNSNILYLGADNGLFRSTDGGRNWTAGSNGFGDARSLVLDSTSPAGNRILFAGVTGGSATGVRESTDGGQTWTQVLSATTPAVAAALPSGGGIGQVLVALAPPTSPANPNGIQVLYASMEGTGGAPDPVGLFRSTDQGGTWNEQASTGIATRTQGGYSFAMGVDPASPGDGNNDIIYLSAVGGTKSTDSGNTFSAVGPGIHVDSHAMWVFARQPSPTPSIALTGNDGGIWKSIDGGATWSGTGGPLPTINGGGLQTALFYNLDTRKDSTASVTEGSLQDNGQVRTTGSPLWAVSQGGDGWDFAFDTANPSLAYQSGGFYCCPYPCTLVFGSTDSGATWPNILSYGAGKIPDAEMDCTIYAGLQVHAVNVDPNNAGYVYVSGASSLFQTTDGGSTFRSLNNFSNRVGEVAVAKANSNIIAVGVRNQVFVSTNALAATVGPPSGVTFTDITRNLPGQDLSRVAIDPNDPTVIYATVSGFGTATHPRNVFRTTIGGTAWTDISPPVNVPINAIALDGASIPTTIYVGTDLGVMRSVTGGTSWSVLDDVHMPNVPVTDLALNGPAGVLRAATFGRGAFNLSPPTGPVIAINAENGLDFGTVCEGDTPRLTIQVFNVGDADLNVNSVYRLFGSSNFTVLPNPSAPLVISPDAEVDFTVQYTPGLGVGTDQAQIRISSNDPGAPAFDLMATATVGTSSIATVIADSGSFGDVCKGSFEDLNLTINNSGSCDLHISGIGSSSTEFVTASTLFYPLAVAPGTSLAVPIRFAPTSTGSKSANISVFSNDPSTPTQVVHVTGNTPSPDVRVTGSTAFGNVCAGTMAEKTVSVCDVGPCDLHVTSAAFEPPCPDFTIINNPFPATVSPDSCESLVIRFTPTSVGSKSCALVIRSDDPDSGVISKTVTADTPVPSLDVPPDLGFPPTVIQSVGACTTAEPFPVSNTGACPLVITNFAVTTDPVEYSLAALPSFPILLAPGEVVGDGNLSTVFAPQALDRDVLGGLTVTYELDTITHATTSVVRNVCGEGVRTGARVLVTAGGIPMASVEQIKLSRINANRNKNLLDTVDNAKNLLLQTVSPAPPCAAFQFHREYGTVSNPIQLLPGSYNVTVTAVVNGKRVKKTVGFDLNTCGFNPTIVVNF
jgi:hypothetical protein